MHLDEIRTYYDRNTRLFLRFGSDRSIQSIHRALWFPGVRRLSDALQGSNHLILQQVQAVADIFPSGIMQIVDLGCGVGATLASVLSGLQGPAYGIGLTLSPVQTRIANNRLTTQGMPNPFGIVEGDFQHLPLGYGFHVAWSIEAFIHALQPELYLQEVSRILVPGGRLILVDDFSSTDSRPEADFYRTAYCHGWHAPNLQTVDNIVKLAIKAGFELLDLRDLTPFLRLRNLPGWLGYILVAVGRRLPAWHPIQPSILGSIALQQALHGGMITYRCLVFARR